MRRLILLIFVSLIHLKVNAEVLCTTPECIEISYRILKDMNSSADPCDDFYKFACGKYLEETRIPDDKSKWTSFEPVEEEIYEQGKTLLEEEPSEDDFESYKLAKDFYKSCMDEEKREQLGVQPLLEKFNEFGGWPVLEGDKWEGDNFTWWEWSYETDKVGFETDQLVNLGITADDKNTTWRVVRIDQATLGLARENLIKGFDDKNVQTYYRFMVDMAVLLGADPQKAESELKDSLNFEIELAHITTPRESRRNVTALYNPTAAGNIPTSAGLPPSWTEYIQRLLQHSDSVTVDDNEIVIITSLEYLEKLGKLISKTDARVLANYLAWRQAQFSSNLLNDEATQIRLKFYKSAHGIKTEPPKWKQCVKRVGFNNRDTSNFVYAVSSMYVSRFFKPEAKKEIVEMTQYLRNSFENVLLKNIDWMDEQVKDKAKLKLKHMDHFIGYSDEYLDKEKVDSLFKGLKMSKDDYFGNTLRLQIHWSIFHINRLRQQIDSKSWIEHKKIAYVNALYAPQNNYMEFPAGILQGKFYSFGGPKFANFGAMGSIIGHELTHGFDDKGKQRNHFGEIENWWDPATEENYKQKAQCIINQYGNYTDDQVQLKLNGITTQGENIADNGGVKEAYHAYLQWVKDNEEEAPMPGLPYNSRQLFWISHGQVWCAKYQNAILHEIIQTGNHAPGEFRINGPLSNNEDFAKDFSCPVGSKMNPPNKCVVW